MSAVAGSRYGSSLSTIGEDEFSAISSSKVLVVGAGGIGCELLKNLSLFGFQNINVIDLDTIDVSNLNRQFLFRSHHVGKSKAEVASAAVKSFNPDINITALHGNIKSPEFGVPYFQKFDIVLNALDNIDARRHVNRLCLAASVPLIDSGTTGYLGQVMPIKKGETACYECLPKPTQKVYPICTIRSTPDKPVHCIVWAKELFKLLFGNSSESMLVEGAEKEESNLSDGNSSSDAPIGDSCYMGTVERFTALFSDTAVSEPSATKKAGSASIISLGEELIEALYGEDIRRKIAMGVYKTASKSPKPVERSLTASTAEGISQIVASESKVVTSSRSKGWEQRVWSEKECIAELLYCLRDYSIMPDISSLHGKLSFDKDDQLSMRFVCAAANLRSSVFGIQVLSYHDCKGIAGNIIPAIATTNAIIAGMQVLGAVKYLTAISRDSSHQNSSSSSSSLASIAAACPHTYCLRLASRKGIYLQPTQPEPPQASCYVCNASQLVLQIDVNRSTLGKVLTAVLKGKLGFNSPSISVSGCGIYEEGEDADETLMENLEKTLSGCPAGGIKDGSLLTIEDFSQDLEVNILVRHQEETDFDEEKDPEKFVILGQKLFDERQQQLEASSPSSTTKRSRDVPDSLIDNQGDREVKRAATSNVNKGGDVDDDEIEIL